LTCANFRSGKSSLTVQFVDGHFVESYYPTIENTFSKVIKYKNQEFATEIIDTAGQVSMTMDDLLSHFFFCEMG
jgi:small GTP-binding protein